MTKPSAGDEVVTRALAVLEQTNYLRGEALLQFAAHVRALSVELTELRAKLAESEEPGTLRARFRALHDWACRITGHKTFSSRPWELSLQKYVEDLETEVARLRAALELVGDEIQKGTTVPTTPKERGRG